MGLDDLITEARSAETRDLDLRFEKQIKLSRERRFRATRAFGHGLNAAQRLGAPGNDQAGVAKLAFAQKNRGGALHTANLARVKKRAAFSDRQTASSRL